MVLVEAQRAARLDRYLRVQAALLAVELRFAEQVLDDPHDPCRRPSSLPCRFYASLAVVIIINFRAFPVAAVCDILIISYYSGCFSNCKRGRKNLQNRKPGSWMRTFEQSPSTSTSGTCRRRPGVVLCDGETQTAALGPSARRRPRREALRDFVGGEVHLVVAVFFTSKTAFPSRSSSDTNTRVPFMAYLTQFPMRFFQHAAHLTAVRPDGQLLSGSVTLSTRPLFCASCSASACRTSVTASRRSQTICSTPDCTLEISNRSLVRFFSRRLFLMDDLRVVVRLLRRQLQLAEQIRNS